MSNELMTVGPGHLIVFTNEQATISRGGSHLYCDVAEVYEPSKVNFTDALVGRYLNSGGNSDFIEFLRDEISAGRVKLFDRVSPVEEKAPTEEVITIGGKKYTTHRKKILGEFEFAIEKVFKEKV